MAERVTCYVHQILPKGDTFATRQDNDEAVYISAKASRKAELQTLDQIEALVVRNRNQPSKTPWFALRVELLEEEEDEA